jgi:hypothetical protein
LTVNNSTGSGATYTVQTNGFTAGALMYSDRTYTLATVPSIVSGQTFIKPPMLIRAFSLEAQLS